MKKDYLLALLSFVLIPATVLAGGALFSWIDPDIAAGHENYERNYQLLAMAKNFCLLAAFLGATVLWFLTCFFLLRSKRRSCRWLSMAIFGPLGFIVLAMLADREPTDWDLYQALARRLNALARIAYELCLFLLLSVLAYLAVFLHHELMILYEAATTGRTRAQIVDIRNASSGMWAFGEGLESLYLLVLLYLLWPILFNLAGHLAMRWSWLKSQ